MSAAQVILPPSLVLALCSVVCSLPPNLSLEQPPLSFGLINLLPKLDRGRGGTWGVVGSQGAGKFLNKDESEKVSSESSAVVTETLEEARSDDLPAVDAGYWGGFADENSDTLRQWHAVPLTREKRGTWYVMPVSQEGVGDINMPVEGDDHVPGNERILKVKRHNPYAKFIVQKTMEDNEKKRLNLIG